MIKNMDQGGIGAKILAERELGGCIVSELAKSHNVSTSSIYSSRRELEAEFSSASNFALLSIKDSLPSYFLKKASLSLEGGIKAKVLLSIIQISKQGSC